MKCFVRLGFLLSAGCLFGLAANSVATVTSAVPFALDGIVVNTPGVTAFPVIVGDVVTTSKGPAVMHFQNGSAALMGENSSVKIGGTDAKPQPILLSGKLDYSAAPQEAQPQAAPPTVPAQGTQTAVKLKAPFNTGVTNDGSVAQAGKLDLHFASSNSVYVEAFPGYAEKWLPADGVSAWVGPEANDGKIANGGKYTFDYVVTFDLTGYDPSSVVLSGRYAASGPVSDIYLNGTDTGNSIPDRRVDRWTDFRLSKGFVDGINTIAFRYTNLTGPGGLRVEFTNASGVAAAAADTTAKLPANSSRPLFSNPKFLIPLVAGAAATGLAIGLVGLPAASQP